MTPPAAAVAQRPVKFDDQCRCCQDLGTRRNPVVSDPAQGGLPVHQSHLPRKG